MITETWLSDIVPDEVVNIPKFSLVRKDRPVGRGGGVQVHVIRESISYKLRLDLSNDQYECVWIVQYYALSGFQYQFLELQLRVCTFLHL